MLITLLCFFLLMVSCFIATLYELTGWTSFHILSGWLLLLWLLNFCLPPVLKATLIDLVYIDPKKVSCLQVIESDDLKLKYLQVIMKLDICVQFFHPTNVDVKFIFQYSFLDSCMIGVNINLCIFGWDLLMLSCCILFIKALHNCRKKRGRPTRTYVTWGNCFCNYYC